MRSALLVALPLLSAGCPCGGPFVAVDCLASQITWTVVDEDGAPAQPDAVRVYRDGALVEEIACTPLGEECQGGASLADVGSFRVEVDAGGATEVWEVTFDADDRTDGCCAGFWAEAEIEIDRREVPDVCASLDVEACAAEPTCQVYTAHAVDPDAACVDYGVDTPVGCGEPGDCPASVTWAGPPDDPATCYAVPGCVPEGWVACDGAVPPGCTD